MTVEIKTASFSTFSRVLRHLISCFLFQDNDKAFKPTNQSSSSSSDKRQTRGRSRGAADDEIVLEGDSDGEDEQKKPSRLNKMPNPNAAAIKRRAEVIAEGRNVSSCTGPVLKCCF